VLAPADPAYPVQFIDARDLAAWMLDLVERRAGGIFNASGPAEPLDFGGFLEACRAALGSDAEFVWPDADFLARHDVRAWTHLPLYAGDDGRGLCAARLDRALAAGLLLRPVGATCVDTARWAADMALPAGIGLDADREAQLLKLWQTRAAA
jgi:2'-hydroxyisoflavone reductase